MEVDRLRRKLAKEARERQQQTGPTYHPARAPTPLLTGAGLSEEQLVPVLNQEMDSRRREDQRVMEERRA